MLYFIGENIHKLTHKLHYVYFYPKNVICGIKYITNMHISCRHM